MRLRSRVRIVPRSLVFTFSIVLASSVASTSHAQAVAGQDCAGTLIALDAATGAERWRVQAPAAFEIADVSRAGIVGRGYSCDTGKYENVAFAAADGRPRWRSTAAPDATVRGGDSLPRGADDTRVVVVRSGEGGRRVEGRFARSGEVVWQRSVRANSNVSVAADSVAIGGYSRHSPRQTIEALDRRTGATRWKVESDIDQLPWAEPGGEVVAAISYSPSGTRGTTDIRDARDGGLRWQADLPAIAVGDSVVALARTSTQGSLSVRDSNSGKRLWSTAPGTPAFVRADGGLLVFISDESFSVADERTGDRHWEASSVRWPSPAVGSKIVVASVDQDHIRALDTETGSPQWQSDISAATGGTLTFAIGHGVVFVSRGSYRAD